MERSHGGGGGGERWCEVRCEHVDNDGDEPTHLRLFILQCIILSVTQCYV